MRSSRSRNIEEPYIFDLRSRNIEDLPIYLRSSAPKIEEPSNFVLRPRRPVESKTQTYHGRVGTGRRTAERRGGADPGRTARRRIGSPRRQPSLVLSKASNTSVLNDSSEARASEILCKSKEEQNPPWAFDPHWTSGLSARRNAIFVPGC